MHLHGLHQICTPCLLAVMLRTLRERPSTAARGPPPFPRRLWPLLLFSRYGSGCSPSLPNPPNGLKSRHDGGPGIRNLLRKSSHCSPPRYHVPDRWLPTANAHITAEAYLPWSHALFFAFGVLCSTPPGGSSLRTCLEVAVPVPVPPACSRGPCLRMYS